tara:strand:+ start:155 stop:616 length:462 start_codon:yes stop_codon:yes gene_type:complete
LNTILRRTTYIVNDIEESIKFYRDIIGLNLLWKTETVLNGNIPVGSPGDKAKFVAFNGNDPIIGMVAFMQLLNNEKKNNFTNLDKNLESGDSILVLGVENCDEIFINLKEINANIFKSPFNNTVNGRDGKKIKMRSMFAWDPNNIFLEINQRL